jgi:hypothetical protein
MKKILSIWLLFFISSFTWASNADVKMNIQADGKPEPFTFKTASSFSIASKAGVSQKIIVQSNFYAPDSTTQRADTVTFTCNGLVWNIRPGDTVLCERVGGGLLATVALTQDDWFNGASGTVTVQ